MSTYEYDNEADDYVQDYNPRKRPAPEYEDAPAPPPKRQRAKPKPRPVQQTQEYDPTSDEETVELLRGIQNFIKKRRGIVPKGRRKQS